MSKRGSGVLLARDGTYTDPDSDSDSDSDKGGAKLVAYKFSSLLQHQSVLTVRVSGGFRARTKSVTVSSVSCSIVPPWVPFSALLALLLFWVPFSDQGANTEYLRAFHRDVMLHIPHVEVVAPLALAPALIPPPPPVVVQPSSSLIFFFLFILLPVLSATYAVLFLVAV